MNTGMVRRLKKQWFSGASLLLNRIAPALVYDFMNERYYNTSTGETGFPFASFRTGNATQFDSQGNLVFGPANMLVNSGDHSTASWTKADTTVSTPGGNAPSGVAARLLTEGVAGTATVFQAISTAIDQTAHTWEIKRGNHDWVRFRVDAGGDSVNQWFNLATGQFGGVSVVGSGILFLPPTAQVLDDGWYRVTVFAEMIPGTRSMQTISALSDVSTGRFLNGTRLIGQCSYEQYSVSSPTGHKFITGAAAYYGPRFDYDPSTLERRGLLIELNSTNLHARSETRTPADWNNASFCTASYPGDVWGHPISRITVTATGAAQFNFINAGSVAPAGATIYTASVFVKRGNHPRVQFANSANFADAFMNYNFDTNTIVLGGANVIAGSGHAQLLQGGWVRLQYSLTTIGVPVAGPGGIISFIDTDAAVRLGGTATNGAFVDCFGFQFEAVGMATSYIPTDGTAITRAAETTVSTSIAWLTQNKGTFYIDVFSNKANSVSHRFLSIDDNTANNRVQITRGSNGAYTFVSSVGGSTEFAPTTPGSLPNFSRDKAAIRYNSAGKAITADASTVATTATSPPVSGYTHFTLGYTTGNAAFGWMREVRYYADDSATNAQIETLTTI